MEALRIFLSHTSQDTPRADAIVRELRAAGADVWYDEHNLGAGHLKNVIQRELGRRPIFLVLLSKAAFASPWVKKEADWADELAERDPTRLILPVTVAPIERSDFDPEQGWLFLHAFKRIEAPGYQPYPHPETVRRLLQALALTPVGAASATSTAPQPAERPEDLLAQGKALSAQRKYTEAIPLFERATQLAPHSFDAWFNLGSARDDAHQYAEAVKAYEQALSLSPMSNAVSYNMGGTLLRMRRYAEALAAFEMNFDPSDARDWNGKGSALGPLNRPAEALAAYEHALVLDPSDTEAWYGKGSALRVLKRAAEALAAYEHALALDPKNIQAWYGKGSALGELKRAEEALAAYEHALTLEPTYALAWNGKGSVLTALNRPTEALAAYDQALTLDPGFAEAWINKGVVLYGLNRYAEALSANEQALVVDPTNAFAWTNQGTILSAIGRYNEALVAYVRGNPWQTATPEEFDADDLKGLLAALRATGRTAEAEAAERRAKELGM